MKKASSTPPPGEKSQTDKFKGAAGTQDYGEDPERFRERAGKLARHKPVAVRDANPDVNLDVNLEAEADAMAARAMQHKPGEPKP